MKLNLIFTGFVVSSVLAFTSCSEEEKIPSKGKGKINVHLTDAPFPIELVSSAWITIDKVELRRHQTNKVTESDSSFLVINDEDIQINLLELTNGITEQIAFAEVESGMYDLIRLHISGAKIILNDGSEFDMKVPSGAASGLKVKLEPGMYLEANQTTDVLLDFDVSRSFVAKGQLNENFKGFSFNPVVRGVFLGDAGGIEGNVLDTSGIAMENILVRTWIQGENINESDDHYLASTFTDEFGNYKLIGLPEGMYSVLFVSDDFGNDTISDVPVSAGNRAEVDFGY